MTTSKTNNNNESNNVFNAQVNNNNSDVKDTAQNTPLIISRKLRDIQEPSKVFWIVGPSNGQTMFFHNPVKARFYMLTLKKTTGLKLMNRDYMAISKDCDELRKSITDKAQLQDLNSLSNKAYFQKYGKISADIFTA